MRIFSHLYNKVTSLDSLFQAWEEFKKGKRKKIDVGLFEKSLENNLFQLYWDLSRKRYQHLQYTDFYIQDPKVRHIYKAAVRDRIVHHALFNALNPIFEPTFIADSYSCRKGYGTHRGFERLAVFCRKASKNYTRDCWALKCDIKKFFDSIDHRILFRLIKSKIKDTDTLWLVEKVIKGYETSTGKGIPIGNLTSQLFANIYLNELDRFVKHKLKVKYYVRYADDFILLDSDVGHLLHTFDKLRAFLEQNLKLELHQNKIAFRKLTWGIDFVGYLALPYHQIIRIKTKRRIFRKLKEKIVSYKRGQLSSESLNQTIQSYLGVLRHANTYKLEQELRNKIWFWLTW